MIEIKPINCEVVKPVIPPIEKQGLMVKGDKLFPDPYSNIFLVARKRSGKTSAIFKILRECMTKDTTLICFVSTIHKDKTWQLITKYFEKKGNQVLKYTSFMEDGINQLEALVKHLENENPEEEEEEQKVVIPKPKQVIKCTDDDEECKEERKRKSKYVPLEYIIVCDDLSDELKNKSLVSLLKKNRHFKAKCILSSQYIHDLLPASLKQIDYWLIFKGMPDDKLQHIYKMADISIPFELFVQIYKKATEKMYSFLYIDTQKEIFRRNFNCIFRIPEL